MKPSRHQIAAGVTVVALGALATVALASGDASTDEPSGAPAAAQSAPEVRTEIVRETVHRRAQGSAASGSGRFERVPVTEPQPLHGAGHGRGRPRVQPGPPAPRAGE